MKILHIGLPKTGTTFLQQKVFPVIAKNENWLFNHRNDIIKAFVIYNYYYNDFFNRNYYDLTGIDKKRDFLISNEGLVGWNPALWNNNINKILSFFGSDCTIIITIRKPVELLTSIYIQRIQEGNVINPEEYFVNNKSYFSMNSDHFNYELFSYSNLVNSYRKYFDNVILIKWEDLWSYNWLKSITVKSEIINDIIPKKKNISYSKNAIEITRLRENMLNFVGLSSYSIKNALEREASKIKFDSGNILEYMYKENFILRLNKKISWRFFLKNTIEKYMIPRNSFNINLKNIISNIDELEYEYSEVK